MLRYAKHLAILLVFITINSQVLAQELRGHLLGRVIIELDGFQGEHKMIALKGEVRIARWAEDEYGDKKDHSLVTNCDENGFFYLNNVILSGQFRLVSIVGESGDTFLSNIPSPKYLKGSAILLPYFFSGQQESHLPIVNMGTSIIVLDKEGRFGMKYSRAESLLSFSPENKYGYQEQEYDFSPVSHYSENATGILEQLCEQYIQDRKKYIKAKPYFLEAKSVAGSQRGDAISKLEYAIKTYSYYSQAYLLLCKLYVADNDTEKAEALLLRGIKNLPEDIDLFTALAELYVNSSQGEKATQLLQSFKDKNPDRLKAYEALAGTLYNQNRYNEAEQVWHEAIRRSKNVKKYVKAGSFYSVRDELNKALFYFQEYYEERSGEPDATIYLANLYIKRNQVGEAKRVLELLPVANTYYYTSRYARQLKEFDLALELCKKSLEYIKDKTLYKTEEELKIEMSEIENMMAFEQYWANYLKKIQMENDYVNWKDKPYNLYIVE